MLSRFQKSVKNLSKMECFAQKRFTLDARQGSKYASAMSVIKSRKIYLINVNKCAFRTLSIIYDGVFRENN